MAKEVKQVNSKLERVNELIEKYNSGLYVVVPYDIIDEANRLFVEVYRRPMCPSCSGDVILALDLLQKKIMSENK